MYASGNGHVEIVMALLAKGAAVNAKDNEGVTALIYASGNGHVETVRALINRGADPFAKTNRGYDALYFRGAALSKSGRMGEGSDAMRDPIVRLLLESNPFNVKR
jgi:ankyrin repeat protein